MCCRCITRREFLGTTSALAAGAALLMPMTATAATPSGWTEDQWDPARPLMTIGKPLRVQPILMYRVAQRKEMTSWKSWSNIQDDASAKEEAARITQELKDLTARAGFPMEILPVACVTTPEQAAAAHAVGADATIVYPATGSGKLLNACIPDAGAIVFVRHKSGPVYYWYEALSVEYLRTEKNPTDTTKRASIDDVVVDDQDELLWRLRSLFAAHNFTGARVVALGGPAGKYAGDAPAVARERYKMDLIDVSYDDLSKRLSAAFADEKAMQCARKWTDQYLAIPGTTLDTDREFLVNGFILYGIFKQIMQENDTQLFTIKECMSTIMPMSKTTACLTLALLNDEGYVAFCESDFVVIPAGILLRYVSGKPVFMHNSTFPHKAVVTCAHCTGPRRMDGEHYDPTRLVTHYESEYGVAPKVDIPVGQEVTFIDPEFTTGRWVGIKGTVEANPFYEICRSQQDVRIQGNWKKLLSEVRDSHWMMAYGDHLDAVGYAAKRIGITWDNISEA
ncbi:MAG: sugar isomerase [Candidatus Hydrogenedentes bacterium]|nr:sugar isomerase [Candidatus Hydrogenedentota bacterium]